MTPGFIVNKKESVALPMQWKIITVLGLSAVLLGCTTSKPAETPVETAARKAPPPSEQQEQLASTIAGATYLRNYCNRSDLGENKEIFNTIVSLAQRKGWDVGRLDQSALTERSVAFYGNLVNSRNVAENCTQLNRSLAGILRSAYAR